MTSTLPDFKRALQQLIATPSISSMLPNWDQGNEQIIHLLATWFEQLGFSITIQAVPHTRNKFNLIAKLGSGEGGLLLAGHSDTVPYDEHRWQSDPHKISVRNDKFYGLGTCDMKGFFAFVLAACQTLPSKKMTKPLYILATADEEITMAGARYFAAQQLIKPDVAIIGEPTSLVPVVMHKGHMSHRITVVGQAGHSSRPEHGVNAIEIMHQVISALLILKTELANQFHHHAFDVPQPTLNLGAIRGGDNANRICGECSLDIDLRALPGLTDEQLTDLLFEKINTLNQLFDNRISCEELHLSSPSFEQQQPSELIRLAEHWCGHSCCAVNYATEAPFIQQLGCETIVLGPGSIDQAHQPNEFLAFSEINKTQLLLNQLIQHYCLS